MRTSPSDPPSSLFTSSVGWLGVLCIIIRAEISLKACPTSQSIPTKHLGRLASSAGAARQAFQPLQPFQMTPL